MGFFKEFKEDLSQAVTDILPEDEKNEEKESSTENSINQNIDMESELSKLNGLLEKVAVSGRTVQKPNDLNVENSQAKGLVNHTELFQTGNKTDFSAELLNEVSASATRNDETKFWGTEENITMDTTEFTTGTKAPISEETTVITEGTTISGDMSTTGSMDIKGHIKGNINCNGKLLVTGVLEGNCDSSEFFADAAKVEGEVNSSGTVKIGAGSIIIGNISASSAVIAGAIKGDIDVKGPVIVDSSAVVMGNIKSKSVQINNGAVIEGFCSQSYSDVDVKSLFGEK